MIGYNFTSRPHYPRETTPVAMEYESGWASEGVWTFRRREKFVASAGIRYPRRPTHSLVSTNLPTTLLRLHKVVWGTGRKSWPRVPTVRSRWMVMVTSTFHLLWSWEKRLGLIGHLVGWFRSHSWMLLRRLECLILPGLELLASWVSCPSLSCSVGSVLIRKWHIHPIWADC